MMERFASLLIRLRIPILVAAAALTAFFASMLPALETDDDVMQFLPQEHPELKLFNKVNERFGGLDVAIVGLEAETMFTVDRLGRIRKMTREIATVDGVFGVNSFTEVPDPQPSPAGGLRVEPLVVEKLPETEQELAELKRRVLSNDNAVGNMISADGRASMVLCFLGGSRPPMHVAAEIKEIAQRHWTDDSLYFGGSPFIRLHVAGGTKEDLWRLTPVVVVVVLLVTFLIFRKPLGVVLALGSVGVALIWLMGAMALRDGGLSLVDSSLPTLLVAIGGAYGIHVLAAYFSGESPTVHGRIAEAMSSVGPPVIFSAATTCAGFLSFLAMDVEPMRSFGLFAAAGVGFTALVVITLVPALLSFSRRVPQRLGSARLAGPLGRLGGWAVRNRGWALVVAVMLAAAGLLGISRIAPDATMKTFFAEGSEPDRADDFLERHFGGSVYLQIYFEGDMRSPFVLAQLRKVVEKARSMEEVVQVNSIIDHLTMLSEAMGWRADLPVSNQRTRGLYPFLEGTAAIDQLIAADKNSSLVQIRLADVGPERVNVAVDELSAFIENSVPHGLKPIKIGRFADPRQAEEYLPAGEADELEPGESRVPDLAEPRSAERSAKLRREVRREIARRTVRLARIEVGPTVTADAATPVEALLSGSLSDSGEIVLEPGADRDAAVERIVEEYLYGDSAWFMPPGDDAGEEASREWERRGELVAAALKPRAGRQLTVSEVREILKEELPRTSARDEEGLDGTASYLAVGLDEARAKLLGERLAGPALAAAGVENPSGELVEKVAGAISDMAVPVHGFPNSGDGAGTVLARVTGMPVINVAFCNSLIENQLRSLGLALVVVTLLLTLAFRSLVSAIKGLAPTLCMLAITVGVMGAAGVPLDPTTSMIAAIALGIGVDYAIHFLWRRRRRGESLRETAAKVGPSIASNALQVAAGFSVLALSDMVPMQRFGLLVAMTMLIGAAATFVLLPALRAEGAELAAAEEEAETVPDSR
jgi:uncharacterized protein